MGCTTSKLDNEDTVRRCKERRRLIKDAVFARHHLAAAHADYCRSLRVTGIALSDFAAGEPLLVVSPSTPSVLLNHSSIPKSPFSLSSNSSYHHLPTPPPPVKTSSIPPPPPPGFSPTIASSNLPHILSSASMKSGGNNNNYANQKVRYKKGPKLPHILSDSSVSSSTPKSFGGNFDYHGETTYVGIPNYNYASAPSQASSVWNWDNFYPPPPPDSEFFHGSREKNGGFRHQGQNRHLGGGEEGGRESEREEVHCSEWGDHYSSTSSDSDDHGGGREEEEVDDEDIDGDGGDERDSRSEISELRTQSHFGSSSVRSESVGPPPPLKKVEEMSEEDGGSLSRSWKNNGGGGGREVCGSDEMRIVVRHKDLKEIVGSLMEYFEKAAAAGDQVSEMLETGRAQLDRSFRQLKSMFFQFEFCFAWFVLFFNYNSKFGTFNLYCYL